MRAWSVRAHVSPAGHSFTDSRSLRDYDPPISHRSDQTQPFQRLTDACSLHARGDGGILTAFPTFLKRWSSLYNLTVCRYETTNGKVEGGNFDRAAERLGFSDQRWLHAFKLIVINNIFEFEFSFFSKREYLWVRLACVHLLRWSSTLQQWSLTHWAGNPFLK